MTGNVVPCSFSFLFKRGLNHDCFSPFLRLLLLFLCKKRLLISAYKLLILSSDQ